MEICQITHVKFHSVTHPLDNMATLVMIELGQLTPISLIGLLNGFCCTAAVKAFAEGVEVEVHMFLMHIYLEYWKRKANM